MPRALVALILLGAGPARAQVELAPPPPPQGIVRFGLGFVELAHVSVGVFFTPWLTAEAMLSWEGVHGTHFGAGVFYAIGAALPDRPPRHALVVGARVMLAGSFHFDSHGDELSSYVVTPVGYGYMSSGGLALQATVGPLFTRQREDDGGHHLGVGVAVTASIGRWF